jgi:alkylation response protein AidB-like acyl-CoA dehydrogenase
VADDARMETDASRKPGRADSLMEIPALIQDSSPHLTVLRDRARAAMAPFTFEDFNRWEEQETYPEVVFEAIRDAGLTGLTVDVELGGEGHGVLEACTVLEELSYAGMAAGLILQMFVNGPPRAIRHLGTPAQHERYLRQAVTGERYFSIAMTEPDAGSAATEMATELRPDGEGFRLYGEKCYITGAMRANTILVFCRAPGTHGARGLGAVVVERGQEGLRIVQGAPKMGGNSVQEAELYFDGVRIAPEAVILPPDPESTRAANVMVKQFNPERCGNAAMVLGVARAALESAIRYSRTRKQFGREICEFQGIQWKIADMAVRLESAQLLLHKAATSDEDGFPAVRATMMAKLAANEAAEFICREALQIHGHPGYTRDLPLERYYREVRGSWLGGGTIETNRNIIASTVIGRRFSQRA